MLTITTPMGTVRHDRIEDAVELLRVSVLNGFPITIVYANNNCTNGIHASGPSGFCECGV